MHKKIFVLLEKQVVIFFNHCIYLWQVISQTMTLVGKIITVHFLMVSPTFGYFDRRNLLFFVFFQCFIFLFFLFSIFFGYFNKFVLCMSHIY